MRSMFSTVFCISILSIGALRTDAQMSEQATRKKARDVVRSELHSRVQFKADQFLGIYRDEDLEQTLWVAVGRQVGSTYVYRVSPAAVELRENGVIYHTWTDVDPVFIVAVDANSGGIFRVHGFGRGESFVEFDKLMKALRVHVTGPDQAESIAALYRSVNPENYEGVTPISRLIDLKQAAERQCQSDEKLFDAGENAFTDWWGHAKSQYSTLSFRQRALPYGGGYLVEWIVLSSPSAQNCGGAPLQARLEISSDGQVNKFTFLPLKNG
jgi:hypothetical protein